MAQIINHMQETPESGLDVLEFRQHWMAVVGRPWVVLLIVSITLHWMVIHPHHPFWHTLKPFYPILRFNNIGTIIALIWGALTVSMWGINRIQIGQNQLVYRNGFNQNRIPIFAIQDVQVIRPIMGMILGYGTLVIDAGRQEERLSFVPAIDHVVDLLNPWNRRPAP